MKGRFIGALLLAILIAAVVWQWHADEAQARVHTLTTLDPDAVRDIEVTLRGLPGQRFERRDGHWTSGAAHVDEGRADDLAALAATPVADWRPAVEFDPAKIGLAPPLAVLLLDGTRVEFGEMTALGKQRYARVGDRIAIVPAQALPRPPRMASLPTTASAP
ncbi:hypothetical protein [Pinirhizobacter sp.]|jgi:hypothetical protein|uniref:hypothetical protein n=1 Tax=Pinirhizobacter sp. TaxID=2950432 RepID=UPI002F3FF4EE